MRTQRVHGIEDRMNFLTYNRDKVGDRYPTKQQKLKCGTYEKYDILEKEYQGGRHLLDERSDDASLDDQSIENKPTLTRSQKEMLGIKQSPEVSGNLSHERAGRESQKSIDSGSMEQSFLD